MYLHFIRHSLKVLTFSRKGLDICLIGEPSGTHVAYQRLLGVAMNGKKGLLCVLYLKRTSPHRFVGFICLLGTCLRENDVKLSQ